MRLYGRIPVLERLKSNPQSIKRIYIAEGHKEASYIHRKAQQWGIPIHAVPSSKLIKLARNLNTQGLLVEVSDFVYIPFEDLLERSLQKNITPVFLDSLNDPQNLGGIMRSLASLGGFCVVLPIHDSVGVTDAVLRVASGGDNHIAVAQVHNLKHSLKEAKEAGFWVAGTVVEGGQKLEEANLPFPLSLVIGSEQKGIREVLKSSLDIQITIPMAGPRLSLNAAQAATIFCYEIRRQKFLSRKSNSHDKKAD